MSTTTSSPVHHRACSRFIFTMQAHPPTPAEWTGSFLDLNGDTCPDVGADKTSRSTHPRVSSTSPSTIPTSRVHSQNTAAILYPSFVTLLAIPTFVLCWPLAAQSLPWCVLLPWLPIHFTMRTELTRVCTVPTITNHYRRFSWTCLIISCTVSSSRFLRYRPQIAHQPRHNHLVQNT